MKIENPTVDQLHALWIRIWNVIRSYCNKLDKNRVQEAITGNSKFWTLLQQAVDELRPVLQFYRLERVDKIQVNDGRTATEIIPEVHRNWQGTLNYEKDKRDGIFTAPEYQTVKVGPPETAEIEYLWANMPMTLQQLREEANRRKQELAPISDALRVLEMDPEAPYNSQIPGDRLNHSLIFLNQLNPARSIFLTYDGMMCAAFRVTDARTEDGLYCQGAFALRRKS